jgi:hypothetical protein
MSNSSENIVRYQYKTLLSSQAAGKPGLNGNKKQ